MRLTAELSPGGRFEILDGVGHYPWLERDGLAGQHWTGWRGAPTTPEV
jgi:hypothetical protein